MQQIINVYIKNGKILIKTGIKEKIEGTFLIFSRKIEKLENPILEQEYFFEIEEIIFSDFSSIEKYISLYKEYLKDNSIDISEIKPLEKKLLDIYIDYEPYIKN